MRRPKKLNRQNSSNSNSSPSSAIRLGPGMETVDLIFTPSQEHNGTGDVTERAEESPWVISWEVGVGASVDKGLRLAKVTRKQTGSGVSRIEQVILGGKCQ